MAEKKLITVFGATGAQGGSVVDIFLSDPKLNAEWKIRGITRDVTKDSAKKLAARGVEVVSANMDDKASLVQALTGSYAVFAVTNYWEKLDMDLETQQGKNIADAAKETGVQHFIFSSLYNVAELTNGKLAKVYHFDSKAKVEEYTRKLGVPSTFFMPGFYMSNVDEGIGGQGGMLSRSPQDNVWTLALPMPADSPITMYDVTDTGKVVKAIVLNRDSLLGERVHAAVAYMTPVEVVEGFRKRFPKDAEGARFFQLPVEAFMAYMTGTGMPEFVAEELLQNMQLFSEGGYFGGAPLEPTYKLLESVGEKLTTWDEYISKSKVWKDLQ